MYEWKNPEDREDARLEFKRLQNNACAICGIAKRDNSGRELALDHNHETGFIRGLLCCNCNSLIGMAKESTLILKRAIAYLDNSL